jgi:hypothetical protein
VRAKERETQRRMQENNELEGEMDRIKIRRLGAWREPDQ